MAVVVLLLGVEVEAVVAMVAGAAGSLSEPFVLNGGTVRIKLHCQRNAMWPGEMANAC